MYKIGLTSIKQLMQTTDGRPRLISGRLLLNLSQLDVEVAEALYKKIVRNIILPNTTGKTTWENRFAYLDKEIAGILKREFPDFLSLLDVGVSDGVTAVDLFEYLKDIRGLKYLASDINEHIFIRPGKAWSDVLDDDGNLIQATIGPFVIPITTISHIHPLQLVNRALYLYIRLIREKRVRQAWMRCQQNPDNFPFIAVSLLSPSFRRLAQNDHRLSFKRLDVFALPPARYDFIRVMNVLNLKRGFIGFTEEQITHAVTGIVGLLRKNGFLLIGRTVHCSQGLLTHATLFRHTGSKIDILRRFGQGSEIESIILKT